MHESVEMLTGIFLCLGHQVFRGPLTEDETQPEFKADLQLAKHQYNHRHRLRDTRYFFSCGLLKF